MKSLIFIIKIFIIGIARNILKLLYLFPIKKDVILFESYNGKSYNDNPKYISDYFNNHYGNFKQIWSIKNQDSINIPQTVKVVQTGSFMYYYTIMTSGVIITNDFLDIKIPIRTKQLIVNTWHGGGFFKKVGMTTENPSRYMKWYFKKQQTAISAFLSSSEYFTNTVVRNSFLFNGAVVKSGMPRNSLFFIKSLDIKSKLEKYFKIQFEKNSLIVLYAPTFRGRSESGILCMNDINININLTTKSIEKKFNKKVYFLYRAHHAIVKGEPVGNYLNATYYPDMQDLLYCSDILISDYSSCMWDFSLTNKPIFVFSPDLQEYNKYPGFFMDICDWPYPISRNNKELVDNIFVFDYEKYKRDNENCMMKLKSYENKDSTKKCVDWILKKHSNIWKLNY